MQVPFPTRNNVFQSTAAADITNTTARPTSTRLHGQHTTRQKAATTSAASSIIDWGQNRHATTRHDAGDANDASQSPSGPLFHRRAAAAADAERCMMGGGGSVAGRGRDEGVPPLVLYHFLPPGRAEDAGCGAGRRRVE